MGTRVHHAITVIRFMQPMPIPTLDSMKPNLETNVLATWALAPPIQSVKFWEDSVVWRIALSAHNAARRCEYWGQEL